MQTPKGEAAAVAGALLCWVMREGVLGEVCIALCGRNFATRVTQTETGLGFGRVEVPLAMWFISFLCMKLHME